MIAVEIILCVLFIAAAATMLFKNVNAPTVLLVLGVLMLAISAILGITPVSASAPTGSAFFDIFKTVEEKFLTSISKLGFMIMTIGGYVALMNKIKATDAMVYIATKPLSFLKGRPYLASVIFIPVGMLIYLTIPSASGLGLLLVSTVYPILINLGVSKTTALSAISAATIFDMGPGSANTLRASEIAGVDSVGYFIGDQLPLVIMTTIVVMVAYYFCNRHFDRKDVEAGKEIYAEGGETGRPSVPLFYAVFPIMPLFFLIVFSPFVGLFDTHVTTAMAMIICTLAVALFLIIKEKGIKEPFALVKSFWDGMGSTFSSVVTLIVTAEIFAMGLTSLKFIDLLVSGTTSVGFGAAAVTVLFTVTVFFSATMMGSGNAAFFSFGPMVPGIAALFGVSTLQMLLPIQLCAGMGRATSPIAAVNVAISGSVGVSPVEVAKRNMLPMLIGASFLTVMSFIINW